VRHGKAVVERVGRTYHGLGGSHLLGRIRRLVGSLGREESEFVGDLQAEVHEVAAVDSDVTVIAPTSSNESGPDQATGATLRGIDFEGLLALLAAE
jgi:hypothetical protein